MSFDFNLVGKYLSNIGFNPFGTGQCLSTTGKGRTPVFLKGFNPFGTGQCLSTAAGCSSLVWQGFPEPLPNFF